MLPGPKLDRIDLKILAKLQQEGRITNVELADAVGLSPSPCLTRVKRLEKAGYITGYGAHVNFGKLGEYLTVFTEVTLSEHRQGREERCMHAQPQSRPTDQTLQLRGAQRGSDHRLSSSR